MIDCAKYWELMKERANLMAEGKTIPLAMVAACVSHIQTCKKCAKHAEESKARAKEILGPFFDMVQSIIHQNTIKEFERMLKDTEVVEILNEAAVATGEPTLPLPNQPKGAR